MLRTEKICASLKVADDVAAESESAATVISQRRRTDATTLHAALVAYEGHADRSPVAVDREGREQVRARIREHLLRTCPTATSERAVQDLADMYPESWNLVRHARRLLGLDARLVTVVPSTAPALRAWIASGFSCRHLRRAVRGSRPADARRASRSLLASESAHRFLQASPVMLARARCLRHVWSFGEDTRQTVERVIGAMASAQKSVARWLKPVGPDVESQSASLAAHRAARIPPGEWHGGRMLHTVSCPTQAQYEDADTSSSSQASSGKTQEHLGRAAASPPKKSAPAAWQAVAVALVVLAALSVTVTVAVLCIVRALRAPRTGSRRTARLAAAHAQC